MYNECALCDEECTGSSICSPNFLSWWDEVKSLEGKVFAKLLVHHHSRLWKQMNDNFNVKSVTLVCATATFVAYLRGFPVTLRTLEYYGRMSVVVVGQEMSFCSMSRCVKFVTG